MWGLWQILFHKNRLYGRMCGIGFLFGRQVAKCHQKEAKSQLK
jgi:hypothetical protein